MKKFSDIFEQIISPENLFSAWAEFRPGKGQKPDVQKFEFELEKLIFTLHRELKSGRYKHSAYEGFWIQDPKRRHIHKAKVRDRIIHHAAVKILAPIFEPTFIQDSFSCRLNKGNHRGVERLQWILRKASHNNSETVWALKCDVRQFFASVDHKILFEIIAKRVSDQRVLKLLHNILNSFQPGVPIGNLTSQLFANVYLNDFDQFVKKELQIPFYIRYTDDFLIIDPDRKKLESLVEPLRNFLWKKLKLDLHPGKITFKKYRQGVDFLDYIQFPHHRLLRTRTRKRIFRKTKRGISEQSLMSYLGVLSHADAYELSRELRNNYSRNKKTAEEKSAAAKKIFEDW
jgi:retron-type reverse transcriptase